MNDDWKEPRLTEHLEPDTPQRRIMPGANHINIFFEEGGWHTLRSVDISREDAEAAATWFAFDSQDKDIAAGLIPADDGSWESAR